MPTDKGYLEAENPAQAIRLMAKLVEKRKLKGVRLSATGRSYVLRDKKGNCEVCLLGAFMTPEQRERVEGTGENSAYFRHLGTSMRESLQKRAGGLESWFLDAIQEDYDNRHLGHVKDRLQTRLAATLDGPKVPLEDFVAAVDALSWT
jgi:hypothetical protein